MSHHRDRSGARWRRPALCSGGQSALPFGCFLCPGKPPGDEADFSAGIRGFLAGEAGGLLRQPLAGHAATCCPCGRVAPACRRPDPGVYNSAYFEHSFLAQQMGVELVEGRDLVVSDGFVFMRTTKGFERIDVLYRRLDDDFLDPEVFRKDSLLGVPGLMEVYRKGRIALVNAPGTGIADDKVVYAYVPKIIKYYLQQDPIVPNVPTFVCADEKDLRYVLQHLDELVVKAANESGGYGMLVGPHASNSEREEFARRVQKNPRNYIAQPTLALSRVPVITGDHFEGRHVDLRPYILYGKEHLRSPRRTDSCSTEERLAGREFLAGRRQQRHLGVVGKLMA